MIDEDPGATPGAPPSETRVSRVVLRTAKLDPARRFYENVIGLGPVSRDDKTIDFYVGDQQSNEAVLTLRHVPDAYSRPEDTAGLDHFALLLPSRRALANAFVRSRQAGATDIELTDHGVGESIYLTDPDGTRVELYRDRPSSTWTHTDEGYVRMTVDPIAIEDLLAERSDTVGEWLPSDTIVGHVNLEVTNLSRSEAFYTEVVGLGVRMRPSGGVFLAAGAYHHHVAINRWNKRTRPCDERAVGLARFDLCVPSGTLADVSNRATAADVKTTPTDHGLRFSDPDGIRIQVLEDASSDE